MFFTRIAFFEKICYNQKKKGGEHTVHTEYYHATGKDALFKIWHASEQMMLIYMHSNGGSIVCSENIYPIQRGVLCLIGSNKYHYTMPDKPDQYDRTKLFLAPQAFHAIVKIGALEKKFQDASLVYAQLNEAAQRKAERILEELQEESSDALVVSAWLRLLSLLDQYALENTASASGFLNHAMDYINRNILSDITIDDICASIHMSKYYFCRKFKDSMGLTVMDYVLKTRLVLAKNMLLQELASVTEISERCCFSSISYFCRVFKEEMGMTPTEYRKNFAKISNPLDFSPQDCYN